MADELSRPSALRRRETRKEDRHVTFQCASEGDAAKKIVKGSQRKRATSQGSEQMKKQKQNKQVSRLQQTESKLLQTEETVQQSSKRFREWREGGQKNICELSEISLTLPAYDISQYSIYKGMKKVEKTDDGGAGDVVGALDAALLSNQKTEETVGKLEKEGTSERIQTLLHLIHNLIISFN